MPSGVYKRTKAHYPPERNRKISIALTGRKLSPEQIKGISLLHKGKKLSKETKRLIGLKTKSRVNNSDWHGFKKGHKGFLLKEHYDKLAKKFAGENCYAWKGGITEKNFKIRNSREYREWRKSIFIRDDFTCQMSGCGKIGGTLNANHILRFRDYPEERFKIENGITLCLGCHRSIHHKEEQFISFFQNILNEKYDYTTTYPII